MFPFSNYFSGKSIFVVKLIKIVSPSLLTCFYPRFRPRLRLGVYFLNIWPKITQKLLSFPRFHFSYSGFVYVVKIIFQCLKLVQNFTKPLSITTNTNLILPYTFLGYHGFLNNLNHANLSRIHLNRFLGFETLRKIYKEWYIATNA